MDVRVGAAAHALGLHCVVLDTNASDCVASDRNAGAEAEATPLLSAGGVVVCLSRCSDVLPRASSDPSLAAFFGAAKKAGLVCCPLDDLLRGEFKDGEIPEGAGDDDAGVMDAAASAAGT